MKDDRGLPHDFVYAFYNTNKEIVEKNQANLTPLSTTQNSEEQGEIKLVFIENEKIVNKLESFKEEHSSQSDTLTVNRMTASMFTSNMKRFGVYESTRQGIENFLSGGLIIFSKKVYLPIIFNNSCCKWY